MTAVTVLRRTFANIRLWENALNRKMLAVVLSCCIGLFAGESDADELRGAWNLQAYNLNGSDVTVSGVLVLSDGMFGMIYTMDAGPSSVSGRAHAGRYRIDGDQLVFDVRLWIQKVEEATGRIPGKVIGAKIELQDDLLVLHFDGGSVQELKRIDAKETSLISGGWKLKSAGNAGANPDAKSLFVADENTYVLLYVDDEADTGRAYGGVSRDDGSLQARWALAVNGETGTANSGSGTKDLALTRSAELIEIRDGQGNLLTFSE
jgi:hypothetical protein